MKYIKTFEWSETDMQILDRFKDNYDNIKITNDNIRFLDKLCELCVNDIFDSINCFEIGLNELPDFSKLQSFKLDCSGNNIKLLDTFPKKLTKLYCSNNIIENIENLPQNIRIISCYGNKIKDLKFLTKNFWANIDDNNRFKNYHLYCFNNPLETPIPKRFYKNNKDFNQDVFWNADKWFRDYIKNRESYEWQKNFIEKYVINTGDIDRMKELEDDMHPKIREEYEYISNMKGIGL